MDEFALIDAVVAALADTAAADQLLLGPGDDAALLELAPGQVLVASIDTLVADRHFPATAPAALIGYRALAVSLSDLAAMGATPLGALVALTTPTAESGWLQDLARGMAQAARDFGCPIAGGNLAKGALQLSVSVQGQVPPALALRRRGAQAGDLILVSGELGGAALALTLPQLREPPSPLFNIAGLKALTPADPDYPLQRYFLPQARLALGLALRGLASAAIDISDGLLADLGHLCAASGLAARLDLAQLPRAAGATYIQALTGGDDYELCFTLPPRSLAQVQHWAQAQGLPVKVIGVMQAADAGPGVQLHQAEVPLPAALLQQLQAAPGFRHFN